MRGTWESFAMTNYTDMSVGQSLSLEVAPVS